MGAAAIFQQGCILVDQAYAGADTARDFPAISLAFRDVNRKLFLLEWTAAHYLYFSRAALLEPEREAPAGQRSVAGPITRSPWPPQFL